MDKGWIRSVKGMFLINSDEPQDEQAERQKLLDLVKQARDELMYADRGFEEAADKDIADYYIYSRKAAEARYNYLIKIAKGNLADFSAQDIRLSGTDGKTATQSL